MLTDYKNSSNKPGVYKIINLIDGKIYIGSAKLFKVRFNQHIKSLEKNKHQNKHLQAAFNIHGTDNFKFEVIEVLEDSIKEYRFQIEQEYLNEYLENNNWELCYNFNKKTIQKERSCFSNTPEETSRKLSVAGKQRYSDPEERRRHSSLLKGIPKPLRPPEHCEAMSKAKTGLVHSNETKQKMSESHKTSKNIQKLKETYEKYREHIIEKQSAAVSKKHLLQRLSTGETIEVTNLNKFCKENNMHSSGFSNILRKGKGSYKGFIYLGSFSQ